VEGQRRATTKDYRNFVCTAEGSLAELQYLLEIAAELGYLTDTAFGELWQQSIEVEKMLQALRLGLDRRMREQAAKPAGAQPVTRNP
jgi:four helix bundle protein